MEDTQFKQSIAVIKVLGVGGGGCNAINSMVEAGIKSADFVAVNTDYQAIMLSKAETRIQIGEETTKGLGAGSNPAIGEKAAEESKAKIEEVLQGTNLLFIAAGMGGGTGTGAAHVIARIAQDMGILTVAVVTKPFSFEGRVRMQNANDGIEKLKKYVDTLVVIPNDKLLQFLPEDVVALDAYKVADNMLRQGVMGIVDLIATPALINLDFADVKTVMQKQGLAHMGIGRAKGEKRVMEAVRQAVSSPLLETTIEGAKSIILNVTGGKDLKLSEINEAAVLVQGIIDASANIIFGNAIDENMNEEIKITVIATGFEPKVIEEQSLFNEDGAKANVPPILAALENEGQNYVPYTEPEVSEEEPEEEEEVEEEVVEEPVIETELEAEDKKGKELPAFMKKLFGRK